MQLVRRQKCTNNRIARSNFNTIRYWPSSSSIKFELTRPLKSLPTLDLQYTFKFETIFIQKYYLIIDFTSLFNKTNHQSRIYMSLLIKTKYERVQLILQIN